MNDQKRQKGFVKGAVILMLFGVLSKFVGAIYRIPLTAIISAEGMGLYQMVFPLYTLMLTISSSGLPSSISKLISENVAKNNYRQAGKVLKVSLILLVCFSCVCAVFVVVFAGVIAKLQGNIEARICYYGLAPAILFVGVISGFRGYFQGFSNMTPSAVSGFIEQICKLAFGLYFASLWVDKGVGWACLGALVGISISELVAGLYLLIRFLIDKKGKKHLYLQGQSLSTRGTIKQVLSLSIFVTLGGLIMPLTMLIDSVVVINILKNIGFSTSIATTLFGIQTGTVGSIINMPVVLSLAVSTAILPCISRCKTKRDWCGVKQNISKAFLVTIVLTLFASAFILGFAQPIIKILYGRSLGIDEINVASNLLEIASVSVLYLALVQVSAGILQGLGKFYIPLISLSVGGIVKILLNLILIRIPSINIYGAELSTASCYLTAGIINICVLKKMGVLKVTNKLWISLLLCVGVVFSKYIFKWLCLCNLNYFLSFLLTAFIVGVVYVFIMLIVLRKELIKTKNTFN